MWNSFSAGAHRVCGGQAVYRCTTVPTALPARGILQVITTIQMRRTIMGKYVLGWILGVPTVVLVVAYLIFH